MSTEANDRFIIAQSQQAPNPLDIEGSLKQLATTAAQAADWGVQLLVLPEMCMTGYNVTPDELRQSAQAANGALFASIAKLCRQHKLAIVYGYAELAELGANTLNANASNASSSIASVNSQVIYNSAQLIDSTGSSLLNYRKTHLWGDLDRNLFAAGDALSNVVTLDGWKIGAAICYDIEFPETVRHLAIKGAEIIVAPTGLMSPYREVATQVIPVRSYENRVFIAYTNYCGTERDLTYEGYSCITDPNGLTLASATSKSVLLTAKLERHVLDDARAALPYLTERRPELYRDLT